MQFSPVLNILGLLTTILAATMLIPMCVDLYFGSGDWQVFAISSLFTAFFGVTTWLATSQREPLDLGLRQAFFVNQRVMDADRCFRIATFHVLRITAKPD
jgi:trk system potassium uptake protein TrkH